MSAYRKRRKLLLFRATCVVLVFLILLIVLDMKIRPTVKTMAAYEARQYASQAINNAVAEELVRENVSYDALCRVSRNEEGQVTALETDIVRLNQLKTGITGRVLESVNHLSVSDLNIPLGTLLGGQYFSGRGPSVGFRVIPVGYAETNIRNEFLSAGINQTYHRIVLDVTITVTAIVPGYNAVTEITTEVCLAETIIVGVVPGAFTEVTGDERDNISKMQDYAMPE